MEGACVWKNPLLLTSQTPNLSLSGRYSGEEQKTSASYEWFPNLCQGVKHTRSIMPQGRCLPQRHDPSSCCTSSSLVWHWKHRRRLFCLDRLVSSDRSVFSSSRGRFTGEASFSDCESDQNNTCGGSGLVLGLASTADQCTAGHSSDQATACFQELNLCEQEPVLTSLVYATQVVTSMNLQDWLLTN